MASETPTPDYLLELDDIEAGYGRAALVLRGLTVQGADRPSIVCLVGPNGAGKSTVLKVASGMLTPRSGTIRVGGVDVTRHGPQDMIRNGLSHVLQGHSVFKEMTVAENVAARRLHGARQGRDRRSGPTSSRRSSRWSPSAGTPWPAPCRAASRSRSSSPGR